MLGTGILFLLAYNNHIGSVVSLQSDSIFHLREDWRVTPVFFANACESVAGS